MVIRAVPIPEVKPGWLPAKVRAYRINRSGISLRSYKADALYIKLPRIPDIEFV